MFHDSRKLLEAVVLAVAIIAVAGAEAYGQTTFALAVTRNEVSPQTGGLLRGFDRLVLLGGELKFHAGVDLYSSDLRVMSANCGVVHAIIPVGQGDAGFGNTVVVRHMLGNGTLVYSQYSHLASFAPGLVVGKRVARGERLATMGMTGNSAGIIHLHFEIKWAPTLGNPFAVGLIPRHSRFGYMPQNALNMCVGSSTAYGYLDPNACYNNIAMICFPPWW